MELVMVLMTTIHLGCNFFDFFCFWSIPRLEMNTMARNEALQTLDDNHKIYMLI